MPFERQFYNISSNRMYGLTRINLREKLFFYIFHMFANILINIVSFNGRRDRWKENIPETHEIKQEHEK